MSKFTNKLNSLSQQMKTTPNMSSLFGLTLIVIFMMTSGFNSVIDKRIGNFYSANSVCENPLAGALGYNVFVRYNTILKGGDTEGPIALGGDLTMDGIITLASQSAGANFFNGDDQASSLVVNGKVIYVSGEGVHLNRGYVKVGDMNGSSVFDVDNNNAAVNTRVTSGTYDVKPRVQVQRKQMENSVNNSDLIDFEAAFTLFEAQSIAYSRIAPNVVISNDHKIVLAQNTTNVLNLTGTALQNLPYLTFENAPSKNTPLIINIDASGDFEWNVLNITGIGDQQGAFIIWNFHTSSNITLKGGSTIIGSVFAPKSDVTKDSSGNINGQVIAANYYHIQGELHQHVFDACTDNEINCQLAVEASEDVEFCGAREVTLTATVSEASECTGCTGEYEVANTNNCRRNQNYVMWLTDGNNPRWFSNIDLEWNELSNGTATLTGTIFDHTLTQLNYEVNAVYSGRTTSTPVNSPKEHECNNEEESGWIYYTELTGTVTSADGSWSIDLSRRGPAFQLGNGANVTETEQGKYGACGWFNTTDGQYNRGDFNFNLGDCVTTSTTEVSYLWSTGETTPSITVNQEGTYTVTVKDCGDCEASDSVEVIINDIPQVDAGEDQEVCLGDEVTLNATIDGNQSCESCIDYGIHNTDHCNDNQNYVLWLNGGRFFSNVDLEWNELADGTALLKGTVFDYTVTQSNYEVDVVFTGKTTTILTNSPKQHICNDEDTSAWEYYTEFTGTITSEDGSWSTSVTRRGPAFQVGNGANVTESEQGKFGACGWFDTNDSEYTVGDFNFNFGDCITSETNNTSFLWSTGETTESITVSPEEDTVYSVTVTNCNGCTATDEVAVSVKSAVVDAGDDQNICLGEAVTIMATGEGEFTWSTGETTETITVSPTERTTYTVTATNGSCEATDAITIVINDPIIVDAGEDQGICLGEEVTLSAQASGIENCSDCTEYEVAGTDYCAGNHDFVIWMTNADRTDKRWYANVDLIWKENGDGTASLTGTVLDYTVTNDTYELDITYAGRTTVAPTNSPKEHECNNEDETGWVYYPEMIGTITKTDGSEVIMITRRGEAFQVGNGANVFETEEGKNGASGWIDIVDGYFAYGDININFGDCITTGQGEATYLWSTGETTQSITVSPEQDTTYTVAVTNCTDCVGEDEVTVMVNSVSADAGEDQTIATGETATLIATGAEMYLWSTGDSTATIQVSPTETTTYTVTASSNGCSTIDEVTVFVEGCTVTADAGEDLTICNIIDSTPDTIIYNEVTKMADEVILTANGGGTYLWSTGETTQSITVSPTETTIYSVIVTLGNCSDTDEVIVNVVDIEAYAGEDQIICPIESFTKSSRPVVLTSSVADSYIWSTGETTRSIIVSPEETTTYEVTIFISNCSDSDKVMVFVEDDDCEDDEESFTGTSVKLYPTVLKSGDKLTIDVMSKKEQNIIVSFYSLTGSSMMPVINNSVKNGETSLTFDVTTSLTSGMYLVKIHKKEGTEYKKFIIE
ncbi:collagen-binding domain-containing protein [Aquimarina sp. M1]